MCCLRRDVWLPSAPRARSEVERQEAAPRASVPDVRLPGGPGRRESTKGCQALPLRRRDKIIEPSASARLARRAPGARSDRSREIPPRLLRSTTPRNDARCLPTSRSTTNNPYTRYRARASGESGAAGHVGAKTGPFFGESDGNCLPNLARGRQPGWILCSSSGFLGVAKAPYDNIASRTVFGDKAPAPVDTK